MPNRRNFTKSGHTGGDGAIFQMLRGRPRSTRHGLDPDHQLVQQLAALRLHPIHIELPHAAGCRHIHSRHLLAQNDRTGLTSFGKKNHHFGNM